MQVMNRSALAILAVVGMAGTVLGQTVQPGASSRPNTGPICYWCSAWAGSKTSFTMKHTVVVIDGSVTDSCGIVGGLAWTWNKTEGPAFCPDGSWEQPGEESEALSYSGCATSSDEAEAYYEYTFHAPWIAGSPHDWEGGAYVEGEVPALGQGLIGQGTTSTKTTAVIGYENTTECLGTWTYDRSESGLGVVGGAFTHEVSGGGSLALGVLVNIAFTRDADSDESTDPWPTTAIFCSKPEPCGLDFVANAPIAHIMTASAEIDGGATLGSTTGAYVQFSDGSFVKLGAFDTMDFDPTSNDDFDLTIPTTGVGATTATLVVDMAGDTFPLLAGDVDGDGDICGYDDREAFMDALGSSIGDANYNLRADFDLDGDVDTNDLDDLNDIGCTADLDCDGSLTIFDQQAFGNAFDAMDPVADWDGDGSFTIFDYQEFGNTYDLGCP